MFGPFSFLCIVNCEKQKAMRIKTAHVRHLAFLSHARKVQGWLQELACAIHVRRKPATAPAFLSHEFLQQSERCLPRLLVTTAKGDKHLEVIFEALWFQTRN